MESDLLKQSLKPYIDAKKELLLGAHIPFKAPDYFLGSVKEALRLDCSAFMIFLGPPSNTKRGNPSTMHFDEGRRIWDNKGFSMKNVAVHFPYVINPASPVEETANFSVRFIDEELGRMEKAGLSLMCLHPGSAKDGDRTAQAIKLVERLRPVFLKHPSITCTFETMAGKGKELNVGLYEAKAFIKAMNLPNFKITLDTCHMWDSGEDFTDVEGLLSKIDSLLGFDKIGLVHLNDSKFPRGSRKDRHEKIGKGFIGMRDLLEFANSKQLKPIPKILETPEDGDADSHMKEISEIRSILSN